MGELNKQIIIQPWGLKRSTIYGDIEATFSTLATGIWAKVEPLSGKEYWQGQQNLSKIDTRFTIRYSTSVSGIKVNSRILYDSDYYEVKSIINTNSANKELIIMTEKLIST